MVSTRHGPLGSPAWSVSVVIPARNDAVALRVCLAALATQSPAPSEVVVVDNASADDTAQVARAGGARVVTEPRVGIPAAAATGYDAATGDVIVRLDADTIVPPGWLSAVVAVLDDPRVDAVTGAGTFYGVSRLRGVVVGHLYLGAYHLLMHAAMAHPPLWGSAMAMRRSTWQRVREQVHRDQDVHDDADLAFALGPHVTIRHDRSRPVLVSGRSLVGAAQTRRRFARAVRTLRLAWRRMPPWQRWSERLRGGPSG